MFDQEIPMNRLYSVTAVFVMISTKLDSVEAKNLQLRENDLGMKVKRTVFQGKDIVEYTSSTVRGDRFVYTINF